jgi:hypothetical protein
MYELKKIGSYLLVNLSVLGPPFIKKNLPGRGLTEVEKPWTRVYGIITYNVSHLHTHRRENPNA